MCSCKKKKTYTELKTIYVCLSLYNNNNNNNKEDGHSVTGKIRRRKKCNFMKEFALGIYPNHGGLGISEPEHKTISFCTVYPWKNHEVSLSCCNDIRENPE